MRSTRSLLASALLGSAFALAALPVQAQQAQTTPPAASPQGSTQAQVPALGQRFMQQAAVGSMFEVQAGQMAQQKSQSQQVKDFARTMIQDHTKMADQVRQLAQANNVAIPSQVAGQHVVDLERMGALQGQEFDRAYIQNQVTAHQQTIDLFQRYIAQADFQPAAQLAQQSLPQLQQHLQMAQQLQTTMPMAGTQPEGGVAETPQR